VQQRHPTDRRPLGPGLGDDGIKCGHDLLFICLVREVLDAIAALAGVIIGMVANGAREQHHGAAVWLYTPVVDDPDRQRIGTEAAPRIASRGRLHACIVATQALRHAMGPRSTPAEWAVPSTVVEGFDRYDDDASEPFTFEVPTNRTWRHPSELASPAPLATTASATDTGFPLRTLGVSCVIALAASLVAVMVATVVVSTRTTPFSRDGLSLSSATTIDPHLGRLLTLIVEDAGGRHSIPGIVLDKLGTIVAAWSGMDDDSTVSVTSDGGSSAPAVRMSTPSPSPVALLRSDGPTAVSPLGSCSELGVGSMVQVMTATGSTTGEITEMTWTRLQAGKPSTPVFMMKVASGVDVTHSIIWHGNKIVGLGVLLQPDGSLVAVPSDVAIGYARAQAGDATVGIPWLGVGGSDIADHGGVLVGSVAVGSSASGMLQSGDAIVAVDGQAITSMWSLSAAMRRYLVGESVELRVISGNQARLVQVNLQAHPDDGTAAEPPTTSLPPR
jgi:S1-C subfamily serine protease